MPIPDFYRHTHLDAQHEPWEVCQLVLEQPEPVPQEVVGEELPLEGAARGNLDALGADPRLRVHRGRVQRLVVLQLGLKNQVVNSTPLHVPLFQFGILPDS